MVLYKTLPLTNYHLDDFFPFLIKKKTFSLNKSTLSLFTQPYISASAADLHLHLHLWFVPKLSMTLMVKILVE